MEKTLTSIESENIIQTNQAFEPIHELLACPFCKKNLLFNRNSFSCLPCGFYYPIINSIADFLVENEGYLISGSFDNESKNYEQRYQSFDKAAHYNLQKKKYDTLAEGKLIEKILEDQGKTESLLDIPCGGGRLSPFLEKNTKCIIETDIAYGQLLYGQQNSKLSIPQIWLRASALKLPLKDASVDGSVCIRLSHHLHSEQERIYLIKELLRVSRRFVILSFNDSYSLKNIYRGWKKRLEKNTMAMDEIARIANDFDSDLIYAPNATFLRTHHYALLSKRNISL